MRATATSSARFQHSLAASGRCPCSGKLVLCILHHPTQAGRETAANLAVVLVREASHIRPGIRLNQPLPTTTPPPGLLQAI